MDVSLAWAIPVTLFFGTWTLVLNFMGIVYIANVIANKDQFEVRVRLPNLTIFSVVLTQLSIIGIALREICAAWGLPWPSVFQEVVYGMWMMSILAVVPYRLVLMVLVFDPSLRRSYYKRFRQIKPFFLAWVMFVFAAFITPYFMGIKGCFTM